MSARRSFIDGSVLIGPELVDLPSSQPGEIRAEIVYCVDGQVGSLAEQWALSELTRLRDRGTSSIR